MTYPPNPPTGPDGPWQQPYPQQQGVPEQYPNPQQTYGAPQQPYGQQYGAPQQYGPPQPYGYGAPQPGYPYPYPQPHPPSGGNGKWLLIIGAVVLVLAVVIGVVVFAFTGSGSQSASGVSSSSSDEDAIRQLFDEASSNAGADLSDALPYFCTADRKLLDSVGDLGSIDMPTQESDTATTIGDITVNGDKATARIDNRAGAGKIYFRKESGEWKFCMSDMPGFPSMP